MATSADCRGPPPACRHRSSQGATVDCEDDRLPYPAGSGAALYEFRKKALPFTRMDVTSAAAKSTLSGFSQVRLRQQPPRTRRSPHGRAFQQGASGICSRLMPMLYVRRTPLWADSLHLFARPAAVHNVLCRCGLNNMA